MRQGKAGGYLALLAAIGALAFCFAALGYGVWALVTTPLPNPRPPLPGEPIDAVDIIVDGASPDLVTFTDPATGCEYLVGRRGGATPRLDAVGRPLCRPAARTGGR